jgi:hypothetical protein
MQGEQIIETLRDIKSKSLKKGSEKSPVRGTENISSVFALAPTLDMFSSLPLSHSHYFFNSQDLS